MRVQSLQGHSLCVPTMPLGQCRAAVQGGGAGQQYKSSTAAVPRTSSGFMDLLGSFLKMSRTISCTCASVGREERRGKDGREEQGRAGKSRGGLSASQQRQE